MKVKTIVFCICILTMFFLGTTLQSFPLVRAGTAAPPPALKDEMSRSSNWGKIDQITRTIEIPAGETYYIYYDENTGTLEEKTVTYTFDSLPQAAKDAIGIVPAWLKVNLTRKFIELSDNHATIYGNLITGVTNPDHVDEVAFAIAHTAKNTLEKATVYPEVFKKNAESIYDNDQYLDYVEITEKDDPVLGRYSTAAYTNKTGVWTEVPMDIYYWYIVHPRISDEIPTFVNPNTGNPAQPPTGKFWRDYLFNYNDSGYPLLKDAVSSEDRIWKGRVNNKTDNGVIGALTQWIQDVMDFRIEGSRPIQPVAVYKKHMGFCGEHADITGAAVRTLLIPCTNLNMMTEDHVWNEFWEGRWVHLEPVNPYIDDPTKYDRHDGGWGRDVTTVWGWRGDGYNFDVTDRYTDTCTLTATVLDSNGNTVDDAEIWIVSGYYQNPASLMITSWGFPDANGQCRFKLGDSKDIYSSADSSLGEDPADQGGNDIVTNVISGSQAGREYTYTFNIPGTLSLPTMVPRPTDPAPTGRSRMEIDLNVTNAVNSGRNLFTDDRYHNYDPSGRDIDFFMVNEMNFGKYNDGYTFDAYEVHDNAEVEKIPFMLPEDETWYAILSNEDMLATSKIVNVTVELYQRPGLSILGPSDDSAHDLDDIISIRGIATSPFGVTNVEISIDSGSWKSATDVSDTGEDEWSLWEYVWNTEGMGLGKHNIKVRSTDTVGEITAQINVTLVDVIDPEVRISTPLNNSRFKVGTHVVINGTASDNIRVTAIDMIIEEDPAVNITTLYDGTTWSYTWDTGQSSPGTYNVVLQVTDTVGNINTDSVTVVLLENVKPLVEITSPENNTVYASGDHIEIEGTAVDGGGVIVVEAIVDGDEEEAINLTRYYRYDEWCLELDTDELELPEGPHEISIRARDAASNIGAAGITVHIDDTEPAAVILTPGNDSVYASNELILFEGTATDNYAVKSVELVIGHGLVDTRHDITRFLEENGSWKYDFDPGGGYVHPLAGGEYSVWIEVEDSVGYRGSSPAITLIIDAEDPVVSIDEDIPQIILIGDPIRIKGTAGDDVAIERIELILDGNEPVNITSGLIDGKWSYLWDTAEFDEGFVNVSIRAFDVKGRMTLDMKKMELISLLTDTDGDGMEDWWEIEHGLDRENDDRGKDPDRDGHDNWAEYLGKSDPQDRRSFPEAEEEESGKGRSENSYLTGGIVVVGIVVVGIIVVGILVMVIVVVSKRRSGKKFEDGANGDPGPEAHGENEVFRYDEGETTGQDVEGPAADVPPENAYEPTGGAIDTFPAWEIEALDTSSTHHDVGESETESGPFADWDEPAVSTSLSQAGESSLPPHLCAPQSSGKAPICEGCGTSSTYYAEHDCYWCDNCQAYVYPEEEIEEIADGSRLSTPPGSEAGLVKTGEEEMNHPQMNLWVSSSETQASPQAAVLSDGPEAVADTGTDTDTDAGTDTDTDTDTGIGIGIGTDTDTDTGTDTDTDTDTGIGPEPESIPTEQVTTSPLPVRKTGTVVKRRVVRRRVVKR